MALYQGSIWTIQKIEQGTVTLVDMGGNLRKVDVSEIKLVRHAGVL